MDSELTAAIPLMRQFSKQIAGHAIEKGSSKPGMMKHVDGSLLKPILPPPRGPRELNFYKTVFEDRENDLHSFLIPLLPAFRGVFKSEPETQDFLKLEDLTENFNHPCILDIKMGAKTYDFEASEQKMQREQQKYKDTKAFGFCIPGMQVFNLKMQKYICNGKDYGKKLNKETTKDAFRLYLNSDTGMNFNVIKSFLLHLSKVKQWFTMQSKYVFFASSLLLIYDADSLLNCNTTTGDAGLTTNHSSESKSTIMHNTTSGLSSASPFCPASHPLTNEPEINDVTEEKPTSLNAPITDVAALTGTTLCTKTETDSTANGCCDDATRSQHRDSNFLATALKVDDKNISAILNLTEVRMIDFAHVFESSEKDENYLQGLNSVINLLEDMLQEAK